MDKKHTAPQAFREISEEQRKEYLEKALRLRRERALELQKLKEGGVSIEEFFDENNEKTKDIRVDRAIRAIPNIGLKKSQEIMGHIGIPATRRLRGLGSNQRKELMSILTWSQDNLSAPSVTIKYEE